MRLKFEPFFMTLFIGMTAILLLSSLLMNTSSAAAAGSVQIVEPEKESKNSRKMPQLKRAQKPSRSPGHSSNFLYNEIEDYDTGQRIYDAELVIKSPQKTWRVKVSDNRRTGFTFYSGVQYSLVMSKEGYYPLKFKTTWTDPNRVVTKRLRWRLAKAPTGHISITPFDNSAKAIIFGATVTLQGPAGTLSHTTSKGKEVATFYNIPAGQYTYSIRAPNYLSQTGKVSLKNKGSENLVKYLKPGSAKLRVRVTNERGVLKGVSVKAVGSGKSGVGAKTNAKGIAELNLSTGKYVVAVSAPNHQQLSQPTVTLPHPGILEVKLKNLKPKLRVRVTNERGPVGGATVSAAASGKAAISARTNSSGVAFLELFPGKYAIKVWAQNHHSRPQPSVTVPHSGTLELKLSYQAPNRASLSFLIVEAATNGSVPGAQVVLNGPGGRRKASTSSDNAYAIFSNLSTGTYRYSIQKQGYKTSTGTFRVTKTGRFDQKIRLERLAAKPNNPAKPNQKAGLAELWVQVKSNRNHTIKYAKVDIVEQKHNNFRRNSRSNSQGIAEFARVPAGQYTCTVNHPDYEKKTVTIDVSQRKVNYTIKLNLKQNNFLKVKVIDPKGKSVPGAKLVVTYKKKSAFGSKKKKTTVKTGADGTATVRIKPQRVINISASKPGRQGGMWARRKGADVPQMVQVVMF